jgi:hypothetical protein
MPHHVIASHDLSNTSKDPTTSVMWHILVMANVASQWKAPHALTQWMLVNGIQLQIVNNSIMCKLVQKQQEGDEKCKKDFPKMWKPRWTSISKSKMCDYIKLISRNAHVPPSHSRALYLLHTWPNSRLPPVVACSSFPSKRWEEKWIEVEEYRTWYLDIKTARLTLQISWWGILVNGTRLTSHPRRAHRAGRVESTAHPNVSGPIQPGHQIALLLPATYHDAPLWWYWQSHETKLCDPFAVLPRRAIHCIKTFACPFL